MANSVAVVVPTRNRLSKTLRFLEVLSQQSYSNMTIIIVDSNSTDTTPETIKVQYPEVVVLYASDADYWAGATNIGVRYALKKGFSFIFTVNDDSVFSKSHIENLISLLLKHNISILGNRIDYLSQPGTIWSLGTYTNWGTSDFVTLFCHRLTASSLPENILSEELVEVDALPGNGVLVRSDVYKKIGLYNEHFTPHYHADTEFTLRAKENGIKVWATPKIILLNDFLEEQKKVSLDSVTGFVKAFFSKKSHLYLLPWLYLFLRYCPLQDKAKTLRSLPLRFANLAKGISGSEDKFSHKQGCSNQLE